MRGVLFDLDNTLIDRDAAFRACLPEAALEELLALDQSGYGDRETVFSAWSRHLPEPMTQLVVARMMADQIFPDAALLDALRVLRARLPLGLISNGNGVTQRWKLEAAGLDLVFSPATIVISEEVRLAKPDPRIFWLACERLGVDPGDCVVVGDHLHYDGEGARSAGMEFRHAHRPLTAASLRELLS